MASSRLSRCSRVLTSPRARRIPSWSTSAANGSLLTPNEIAIHRVALVVTAAEDSDEPSLLEPILSMSDLDNVEAQSVDAETIKALEELGYIQ